MKIIRIIRDLMVAAAMAVLCGCGKSGTEEPEGYGRVLILYSAGYNSLSSYLEEDIEELGKGWLPSEKSSDILLVINKTTIRSGDYVDQTSPCIFRMYKRKKDGTTVRDTLYTLQKGAAMASSDNLRTLLSKVVELYPSQSYGMILSSHATGWMPSFYFNNPRRFEGSNSSVRHSAGIQNTEEPYVEAYPEGSHPMTKSVTQEVYTSGGLEYSYEIDIQDFAAAIPMHLDYILFDACLMGGVEVAWQLRNVTDFIGASQAETLADGFDYSNIGERLLHSYPSQPQKVCEDFFNYYNSLSGDYRSATISYVDCSQLDGLASVCRSLFQKYRDSISSLDGDDVQGYFYDPAKHWHYDLYDIVAKAGATADELSSLQAALDKCVLYNAATPMFFEDSAPLTISTHCGLSMYLPSMGSEYLDNFYQTISWNMDTNLLSSMGD